MSPRTLLTPVGITATLLLASVTPAVGVTPDPVASPSPMPSVQASQIAGSTSSPSPSATPCVDTAASPAPTASPALASVDPEAVGVASPYPSTSPLLHPSPSPSASVLPCTPDDPKVGLGVGPSQIILSADQSTGSFTIYNGGNMDQQVVMVAQDFTYGPDGRRVPSDLPLPQGAASWLQVEPESFNLAPEESRTVDFHVTIPTDAAPGDHFASIRIASGFTPEAWARYLGEHPAVSALSVQSRVGFSVDVVARVPGEVLPRIVVPPFEAFLPNLVLTADGLVAFTPRIENEGNVAAVWMPVAGRTSSLDQMIPTLQLNATGGLLAEDANLFAGTVGENGDVNLSPLVVLPGATHTQRLTLTDAPLFGTYDYLYTLPGSDVDGRPAITRTGSFTVINLQKVLFWVVLPLLVLLLLGSLIVYRRHRIGTQRRVAAALRARELQLARQEAYEQAWREQQAARGHHPR